MEKKWLGLLYILIGFYFSIINILLSIIFLQFTSSGFVYQLNSSYFWYFWFNSGGWTAIIAAIFGIYLIIIGIKKYREQPPSNP
jgi:hypothetical protein